MYKRIVGKKGERYYLDGKMVSKSKVPQSEIDRLNMKTPERVQFDAVANLGVEVVDLEGGFKRPQLHETLAEEKPLQDNVVKEPKNSIPAECLFCGGKDEFQRAVFMDGRVRTIHYCEEHYHSMNLGKTVAKLREEEMV